MGVANTKGTIVTNRDATPRVQNDQRLYHGKPHLQIGMAAVAAADDNASVYRIATLSTSAVLASLRTWNDAITGGTAYDLGFYHTAANGGAVIDQDVIATDVDMSTARTGSTGPLDVLHDALALADCEKAIWELLGYTNDPKIDVDLCWTADTVGSAAGRIRTNVDYMASD